MPKYNAFLDIVTERHDPKIKRGKMVCPYCGSKKVKDHGSMSTLVSGYNNHITTNGQCEKCHKTFTLEVKEEGLKWKYIAWYVSDNGKILKGIPGCFETYTYTCNSCSGDVIREHLEEHSDNPVRYLSSGPDENGVWKENYRTIFRCTKCGVKVHSANGHYYRKLPKEISYEERVKEAKKPKKLLLGWTVTEEIGTCIINDKALKIAMGDNTTKG